MKSSYRFLKVPLCLFSESYSQLSVAPKQKGLLRKSFLFWIASRDLKATVPTEGRQKRHGVTFLRRELHQPLLFNTPQQTSWTYTISRSSHSHQNPQKTVRLNSLFSLRLTRCFKRIWYWKTACFLCFFEIDYCWKV